MMNNFKISFFENSIQQFIPTDMENDVQSWSSESSVIETFNIPPPPLPPRYSDGAQLDNNFQRPKQVRPKLDIKHFL